MNIDVEWKCQFAIDDLTLNVQRLLPVVTFSWAGIEMNNRRAAALTITACACSIIYTMYIYRKYINTSEKHTKKESIYIYNGTADFLINTKGCYIPNYGKTFVIKEPTVYNNFCGERAVFVEKIEDYKIEFRIDETTMNKYSKYMDIQCYYNFAGRSHIPGLQDKKLRYTQWVPFKNGTKATLLLEVITVKCITTLSKNSQKVYEDAYVFVIKIKTKTPKRNENTWNVLIIGMDSMSRARLFNSMPSTVRYFQEHGWLDYKGYQKVGYNTFPNIMAFLSGKKMSSIYKCMKNVSICKDLFIWNRFKDNGYLTAYGEDSLQLPDTFSRYDGFQIQPTHHYLRPFFLTGENEVGNVMCTKHKPSAINLLDYINDFVNTYKIANFFGAFWINSYSHSLNHVPTLLDNDMVKFFEQLNESKVLNNTIVMFTSDHGTRYGKWRLPIESYYDERLPMLFVWIPHDFRVLHEDKYYNLQLNQNRLVTPYDLYVTLGEIRNNFKTSNIKSEACPHCTSFFEEKSPLRTCTDAGVDKKWCSCHGMTEVGADDTAVATSLQLAVKHIQSVAKRVKTRKCKACRVLHMMKVLRTHSYRDSSDNKTHYVVAWQMSPGAVAFEATVEKDGDNFTILEPTHTISEYNKLGHCVLNSNDRQFCVCKTTAPNCT